MKNNLFGFSGRVRRWRAYQNTVRELDRLSAHELNDLGISRYDIPSIARQSAQKIVL